MADPARVKSDSGNDVTPTEHVHQNQNAGEGSSGGASTSAMTMDPATMKPEDKMVRRVSLSKISKSKYDRRPA